MTGIIVFYHDQDRQTATHINTLIRIYLYTVYTIYTHTHTLTCICCSNQLLRANASGIWGHTYTYTHIQIYTHIATHTLIYTHLHLLLQP